MRYFALALCFMLAGCGEPTQSGPATGYELDMPKIAHGKYTEGTTADVIGYSLVCIDGITYILASTGIAPKYTRGAQLQTCER